MLNLLKTSLTAVSIILATPVLSGETILSVTGSVQSSGTATAESWEFDLPALKALPSERFTTTTIWTEGEQTFEGVTLAALLEHVGASGGSLRAIALNDYAVDIPASDATQGGPIVAYQRNGEDMSVRDKGPLWIIYPFDDTPSYKTEEYYSRSIWQLAKIEVKAGS